MEELILTRPASEYAGQIAEYRQEFLDAGDSMAERALSGGQRIPKNI